MSNNKSISVTKYLSLVSEAKKYIAMGKKENYQKAKLILDELEMWRPMRIEYICARVELMLVQGESKSVCRNILNAAITEKYYQPVLADVFYVKKYTFEKESLGWDMCNYTFGLYKGDNNICMRYEYKLSYLKKFFLKKKEGLPSDDIKQLAELYYITRDWTMYFVLMMVWCKLNNHLSDYKDYINEYNDSDADILNSDYLAKQFQDGIKHVYVLIDMFDKTDENIDVLALSLKMLGHTVVILRDKQVVNEIMDSSMAVNISINNAKSDSDFINIRPLMYHSDKDGEMCDNYADILLFLSNSINQKGALIFFVNDSVMEKLLINSSFSKCIQKLSGVKSEKIRSCMAFGWAGSYLKYMEYIYGFDMAEKIDISPKYDYSIVIPVRNNAESLKYTLRTCLQIEYDGKYEIIVSDNSDPEELSVEQLCNEFNDKRIKYYRTPFVLSLPKSFEFAFMQTNGDFILSIGADDGIFPWCLNVLSELQKNMDECEIIKWKRGFYAWPGFNYGQQNLLQIPYPKSPTSIEYSIKSGEDILRDTLADVERNLYNLPLLYINSGFKRSYLKTLMNKTGRLWDTASQDVPMGTISVIVNHKIMCTEMPLTIAGMMTKSIGYQSRMVHDSLIKKSAIIKGGHSVNCLGAYATWNVEGVVPNVSVDITLFYAALIRMYALKMIDEHELKAINWRELYIKLINYASVQDISFENFMSEIRYSAKKLQGGMSGFVDDLYEQLIVPVPKNNIEHKMERTYPVGFYSESNILNIDGSEFNIKNIEEAVHFSSKLLHICDNLLV